MRGLSEGGGHGDKPLLHLSGIPPFGPPSDACRKDHGTCSCGLQPAVNQLETNWRPKQLVQHIEPASRCSKLNPPDGSATFLPVLQRGHHDRVKPLPQRQVQRPYDARRAPDAGAQLLHLLGAESERQWGRPRVCGGD